MLRFLTAVPEELQVSAERLRRFRNELVHGIKIPDADYIRTQTIELQALVNQLRIILEPDTKPTRKPAAKKKPKSRT